MNEEQKAKMRWLAKEYDQCRFKAVEIAKEMHGMVGHGPESILVYCSKQEGDPGWMQKKIESMILREEALDKLTLEEKKALQLVRDP